MLAEFATPDALTGIAALLVLLFGSGGLYALIKVRPEADSISVTAANAAIQIQSSVIDRLEQEVKRLQARLSELERTSAGVDQLKARVDQLEHENAGLRSRITGLEAENTSLHQQLTTLQNGG